MINIYLGFYSTQCIFKMLAIITAEIKKKQSEYPCVINTLRFTIKVNLIMLLNGRCVYKKSVQSSHLNFLRYSIMTIFYFHNRYFLH